MQIKVRHPRTNRELILDYNLGENLEESVGLFGEDVVHRGFTQHGRVRVQAFARQLMEAEEPDDVIHNAVSGYVMGSGRVGGGNIKAQAAAAYGRMSEEERKEFLADLKAKVAG